MNAGQVLLRSVFPSWSIGFSITYPRAACGDDGNTTDEDKTASGDYTAQAEKQLLEQRASGFPHKNEVAGRAIASRQAAQGPWPPAGGHAAET